MSSTVESLLSYPRIDLAVKDALAKSTGAVGLKDVRVDFTKSGAAMVTMVARSQCFFVEGIPVK